MMSRVALILCPLLPLILCTLSLDLNKIQVYPENGGVSGVFLVSLMDKPYSFNATDASEVCEFLKSSIATRAQVETAQRNGFQTCRFGWVQEQISVIPRTEKNEKCAKNQLGVLTWPGSPSRLFDAFCFKSTGKPEASAGPTLTKTAQSTPTPTSLFLSTPYNKRFPFSSSSAPSTSSAVSTSSGSTFFLSTTDSTSSTSNSSAVPLSNTNNSLSTSSSFIPFTSPLPSSDSFTNSSFPNNHTEQSTQSAGGGRGSSFGKVSTACVIMGTMVFLMVAAGGVWYFKIKQSHRLPPWVRIRNKDKVETEMWNHTDQQHSSKQKNNRDPSLEIILQMEDDAETP